MKLSSEVRPSSMKTPGRSTMWSGCWVDRRWSGSIISPICTDLNPLTNADPGLDHLAFACANRSELEQWESRLNELGIANGGIVDAAYGSGLSFRDPDNVALEFFAPPG